MLVFAMDFASEQTSLRVAEGVRGLGDPPHPRDVLRVMLSEMLPLHPDSRATSRMSAAYVLEALHDANIRTRTRDGLAHGRGLVERIVRQAIADGHISPDRNAATETNLLLALIELNVIEAQEALTAVDQHLDRLFANDDLAATDHS
jgi:hypothetical protein